MRFRGAYFGSFLWLRREQLELGPMNLGIPVGGGIWVGCTRRRRWRRRRWLRGGAVVEEGLKGVVGYSYTFAAIKSSEVGGNWEERESYKCQLGDHEGVNETVGNIYASDRKRKTAGISII